ncbi:hypothetical protein ACFWBC_10330 [Streptomyces sp. NPDC059985]|uniref:hypothetical protein n=1 Tax=Streptomyces sp. NPDC059985 TaxID=3347025 RepID=UPI0036BF76A2
MPLRQLALFAEPRPSVVIEYARHDGGPLTDEDFTRMQELARAASSHPLPVGKVTIRCR